MAIAAQFAEVPNVGMAKITGASGSNTSRIGAGTPNTDIWSVFTTGASGSRIDKISIRAAGTVVVTMVGTIRLFVSADNGTTKRLLKEILVTAITPSASAEGFNYVYIPDGGLILPTGYTLWVSSQVVDIAGNQFDVIVQGGNF